jgi:hypothetical protein
MQAMSQDHDQQDNERDADGRPTAQEGQAPHDAASEGHAGQGSESALKQMRAWEEHRATHSGGKRHGSPV